MDPWAPLSKEIIHFQGLLKEIPFDFVTSLSKSILKTTRYQY
jgi:hypothetical protein